jgi:hypothetical protein
MERKEARTSAVKPAVMVTKLPRGDLISLDEKGILVGNPGIELGGGTYRIELS